MQILLWIDHNWHYDQGYIDISMPGYVVEALHKFQYKQSKHPQHAIHKWTTPVYWQKCQYTLPPSSLPVFDSKGIKRIQSINGTFLYYACAVDPYILPIIDEMSTQQDQLTEDTNDNAHILMDYANPYPNTIIRYKASNMKLYINSDSVYLVLPKARNRGAGHFYLSNHTPPGISIPHPTTNESILNKWVTLYIIMA